MGPMEAKFRRQLICYPDSKIFLLPAPTPAARPMIGRSISWRALCEPGELVRSPVFSVRASDETGGASFA
jgi:hypothetical protein